MLSVSERIEESKFCRWHLFLAIHVAFFTCFAEMLYGGVAFLEDEPPFLCKNVLVKSENNWTLEQIKRFSSPKSKESKIINSCDKYVLNYTSFLAMDFNDSLSLRGEVRHLNISKCHDFYYYPSVGMHYTVVNQWNLVCDKSLEISNMASVFMAGSFAGNIFAGTLGDRFGRKPMLITALIVLGIVGTIGAVVNNFIFFMISRFLLGFCYIGTMSLGYVLTFEFLSDYQRSLASGNFWNFASLSFGLLGFVAWLVRDWRYMQILSSLPLLFCIIFIWTLPESPRWLASRGRKREAHEILDKIYREKSDLSVFQKRNINITSIEEKDNNEESTNILALRHHPGLWIRTAVVLISWFGIAAAYFGISLMVTFLGGNVFLDNAISGFIEIPGALICQPLLRWARKKTLVLFSFLTGISFFLYIAVPQSGYLWAQLIIAFASKLFVVIAFNVIYVVTVEIYPTCIAGAIICFGSMSSRLGGIAAPYIIALKQGENLTVPMIVFGGIAILVGACSFLLPESKGKDLPKTFEEAKEIR